MAGFKVPGWVLPVLLGCILALWNFHPLLVTRAVEAVYDLLTSAPVKELENQVHSLLEKMGVPRPYPDTIDCAFVGVGMVLSFSMYWLIIRNWRRRSRKTLEDHLDKVLSKVELLQEELERLNREELLASSGKGEVRIFMEGAFDLMHYGHMNAFRLGRSLGTYLIVGVNSSDSITESKGFPPVMSDEERCSAVRGCRFVDQVVERTPYVMSPEYLDMIVEKYNVDYVVHGNDPCLVDGKDVYAEVKRRGKFKYIPRTEGVSTTDFVGRMLLCTSGHHDYEQPDDGGALHKSTEKLMSRGRSISRVSSEKAFTYHPSSRFNTKMSVMRAFSKDIIQPPAGAKIVYMDGAWDMFHNGHIQILKHARELGDYLIVGIYSDKVVNRYRGSNFPILNLNERVLSVLGCEYADDVLIDAPWDIDRDMIKSLNIDIVAHGTIHDAATNPRLQKSYQVPKKLGIYREITSECTLTVSDIIGRINANRSRYLSKLEKKSKAEQEYYDERYGRDNETSK
eukprot:CAMPEP_0119119530 /NCGR_PEP_ID=MMETSP1310-20130426/980_1 /TAXON_ID=464262 /ORGANISM="Genus nov. species nov., Strain RCC2339" /LENGTH=509 /DNA_ID=CAMNT_0007108971 /DNA_START=3 /DNA_END=1532 /DNA_ORIENTATION=-